MRRTRSVTVIARGVAIVCVAVGFGYGAAGIASASSATFSNASAISIPSSGTASPYPSTIAVPLGQAAPAKVTVTISGFSHTWPEDVDVLLVGPGGQIVTLISDAGRTVDPVTGNCLSSSVSNLTLAFDDSGSAPGTTLSSGTYRPTNLTGCVPPGAPADADGFPSPAPAGSRGTSLSVFSGLSPVGTWRLFVIDDLDPDNGIVSNGWSLTFETDPQPPFTDSTLTAGSTVVKAVHLTELRSRINALRARYGLAAYTFTDTTVTASATTIRAVHITELRTALSDVYAAASLTPPVFTDASLSSSVAVKAAHVSELRAAVIAVE